MSADIGQRIKKLRGGEADIKDRDKRQRLKTEMNTACRLGRA
jgi:hypothetical protein